MKSLAQRIAGAASAWEARGDIEAADKTDLETARALLDKRHGGRDKSTLAKAVGRRLRALAAERWWMDWRAVNHDRGSKWRGGGRAG